MTNAQDHPGVMSHFHRLEEIKQDAICRSEKEVSTHEAPKQAGSMALSLDLLACSRISA